jgi:hypothetical protein
MQKSQDLPGMMRVGWRNRESGNVDEVCAHLVCLCCSWMRWVNTVLFSRVPMTSLSFIVLTSPRASVPLPFPFSGTPPRRPIQEHLTCNDASFRKCKSGGDRRVYVRALPLPTALTHVLVLAVNHIDTAPRAIRKYLFLTPISIDEFAMQSPGRPFSGPRR